MKARALICNEKQEFELADVALPEPGAGEMVVRATATGVSVGTEFALIRNKISWGPYPLCTGYQGIGVVEQTGDDVTGFAVGDKVYYRDNKPMTLADGTTVSPVAGTHASKAVIDPANTHGVAVLPQGVSDEVASMFVMPAVGLWGVDMSNPRMGETVVVYGAGLIGLGVIAACAHRGCVVVAVDLRDDRLEVAAAMGADVCINASRQDVAAEVGKVNPDMADVVFEATGLPQCLDPAIELCRTFGKFVWQGNYGEKPVSIHFLSAHGRQLTTFFPCDDGLEPCRRAVIKNMISGALPWQHAITHRVSAREAADFYRRINAGEADDVLGAVILWD